MMPHSGEQARREQILPVDLDIGTYTFSSADCVMESIRSTLAFLVRPLGRISGEQYDWSDLQRLVRQKALPSEKILIRTVVKHYAYLNDLYLYLQRIVADSRAHREAPLVKKLCSRFV
jgi:hypothetical protein